MVEAAMTTIQDCEDSVAAVDAAGEGRRLPQLARPDERPAGARPSPRASGTVARRLNEDRRYTAPEGRELTLPGRSLMLVRNVGHHMRTEAGAVRRRAACTRPCSMPA